MAMYTPKVAQDPGDFEQQISKIRHTKRQAARMREREIRATAKELVTANELLSARLKEESSRPTTTSTPLDQGRLDRLIDIARSMLCPALQSVSNDTFDLAKVIVPMLFTLKVTGKLPLDVDVRTVEVAGVTLVMSRAGVANFCADVPLKKERRRAG